MTVEQTYKVIAPDGETTLVELILQEGGKAASIKFSEDWYTPATLEEIAIVCQRMASLIKGGA